MVTYGIGVHCERCGLVGYAASFGQLQAMRAQHEAQHGTNGHVLAVSEPHAQDSVSCKAVQGTILERVAGSNSLSLTKGGQECHS